jgi:bifunctional DNase/RNase
MIELVVDSIRVSMVNYRRLVLLKEKDKNRYLPIWIGNNEADAITLAAQKIEIQRPLTHDLLQNFLLSLGYKINFIVIDKLQNDTFFARVVVDVNQLISYVEEKLQKVNVRHLEQEEKWITFIHGGKRTAKVIDEWEASGKRIYKVIEANDADLAESKINDRAIMFEISHELSNNEWLITKMYIDARSSDAIALAVRGNKVRVSDEDREEDKVPIYIEDDILDAAGVNLDKDTNEPAPEETNPPANPEGKQVIDEEMKKKASAFYDYINKIDLDDFGKRKS